MAAINPDAALLAKVVAALASARRPIALDRARLERQMRDLALGHVAGQIGDAEYLARLAQLRAEVAALDEPPQATTSVERATEWLRALAETWRQADVAEAKGELLHAIYDRIVVAGRQIVSARLTPSAYEHGLALALPETVQVAMARPAGARPVSVTKKVDIVGRRELLEELRRSA